MNCIKSLLKFPLSKHIRKHWRSCAWIWNCMYLRKIAMVNYPSFTPKHCTVIHSICLFMYGSPEGSFFTIFAIKQCSINSRVLSIVFSVARQIFKILECLCILNCRQQQNVNYNAVFYYKNRSFSYTLYLNVKLFEPLLGP